MSFTQARNLSIRDSWLVLAIAAALLLLKEAPKCPHCALASIYTEWQQPPVTRRLFCDCATCYSSRKSQIRKN